MYIFNSRKFGNYYMEAALLAGDGQPEKSTFPLFLSNKSQFLGNLKCSHFVSFFKASNLDEFGFN